MYFLRTKAFRLTYVVPGEVIEVKEETFILVQAHWALETLWPNLM